MNDQISSQSQLNKNAFDGLLIETFNEVAYVAMSNVISKPHNRTSELIFLTGKNGTGKTMMIEALTKHGPTQKTYHKSTNVFSNDFVTSIVNNSKVQFVNSFLENDILIFENFEHIQNKEKTLEALCEIIRRHLEGKKLVILTSSKSLRKFKRLPPELRSILSASVCLKIDQPRYKTRLQFVNQKALEHKLILRADLAGIIAHHGNKDFRSLEGMIRTLKANCKAQNATPSHKIICRLFAQV